MMHVLTIGDKKIMFKPPSGLNYRPKRGMIGRGDADEGDYESVIRRPISTTVISPRVRPQEVEREEAKEVEPEENIVPVHPEQIRRNIGRDTDFVRRFRETIVPTSIMKKFLQESKKTKEIRRKLESPNLSKFKEVVPKLREYIEKKKTNIQKYEELKRYAPISSREESLSLQILNEILPAMSINLGPERTPFYNFAIITLANLITYFIRTHNISSITELRSRPVLLGSLRNNLIEGGGPSYDNLHSEIQRISRTRPSNQGYGFVFEELCQGTGPIVPWLMKITNDTSRIVGSDIGPAENKYYKIDPEPIDAGRNQREYCVYDLVQLTAVIELKYYFTHSLTLNPLRRMILKYGVRETKTIIDSRGRRETRELPGMPITATKFEGNAGFTPYFIEVQGGEILLYNVLQHYQGSEKDYIYKDAGKKVFYLWGTENGLFYFNLTDDIKNNPRDYEKINKTLDDGTVVFSIQPKFPHDLVIDRYTGARKMENYYIPFNRIKLLI